jgi:hypothetical protein
MAVFVLQVHPFEEKTQRVRRHGFFNYRVNTRRLTSSLHSSFAA